MIKAIFPKVEASDPVKAEGVAYQRWMYIKLIVCLNWIKMKQTFEQR